MVNLLSSVNFTWALVALATVVACSYVSPDSDVSITKSVDSEAERALLIALCRRASSMNRLSQMESLVSVLKKVLHVEKQVRDYEGGTRRQNRKLMPDPMKPCVDDQDAILELGELIKERANVCKSTHLDKIEAYHEKWINVSSHKRPKVTRQFFRLYANQVSFNCRRNLLHWLNAAEDKFFSNEKYRERSVDLPWLAKESSCKDLLERKRQDGDGDVLIEDANHLTDEERRCLAGETLTITSIGELVEALYHDNTDETKNDADLILLVPSVYHDKLDRMIATCARVEPVFRETIIPIVRLARLGYYSDFDTFERKCQTERVIQEWFSITLVCSSLLGSKVVGDNPLVNQIVIVVDNNTDGNNETARAETQQAAVSSLMIENPIEDELWLSRYNPNRLSKIKKKFFNKVFKVFKIEDVKSRIVFRKRVSDTTDVVRSVVLASLVILGINLA